MKRHEELVEQYEDAAFALLMEGVIRAQGEEAMAENQRLREDPEADVPGEVTDAALRTIRRRFAQRKALDLGKTLARGAGRVDMFVGVFSMCFTAAFASSRDLREKTINTVLEVFEDHATLIFEDAAASKGSSWSVGWVPEGFEVQNSDPEGAWVEYTRPDGGYLCVSVSHGSELGISFDTEDADVTRVEFQSGTATVVEEDYVRILWIPEGEPTVVDIIGEGITREEALRVLESVELS